MDIVYLLALVAGTFVLLGLLNVIQRAVLTELKKVLYVEQNLDKYRLLLQNKRMELIFRKGTLLILRLDGYLAVGNDDEIRKLHEAATAMRMSKSEKLNLYQKLFNYYLATEQIEQVHQTYDMLISLLNGEMDDKLMEILEDTRLLYGIYVKKDTALIPALLELQKKQSGRKLGITSYRLAKLYWYAGDKKKVMEQLVSAETNLKGTDWELQVKSAIEHPELLENR